MQIISVRHKGLKQFIENDDSSGISAFNVQKIRNIITALHVATDIEELKQQSLPGWKLHQLKGGKRNMWSISLTGNWRIVFEVINIEVYKLDLVDYH